MTKHRNKRLLVLSAAVVVLLAWTPAVPQDIKHAPNLESCLADLNLWTSEIPGYPNEAFDQVRSALRSLTTEELNGRRLYIGQCALAYPVLAKSKPDEISATTSLGLIYQDEMETRYFHFLLRHNMLDKFRADEASGER